MLLSVAPTRGDLPHRPMGRAEGTAGRGLTTGEALADGAFLGAVAAHHGGVRGSAARTPAVLDGVAAGAAVVGRRDVLDLRGRERTGAVLVDAGGGSGVVLDALPAGARRGRAALPVGAAPAGDHAQHGRLIRASSHIAGCMRRSPASHCCQTRQVVWTRDAATVCVRPWPSRHARISSGRGLRDGCGVLRERFGWALIQRPARNASTRARASA